jgi:hypothetical protein
MFITRYKNNLNYFTAYFTHTHTHLLHLFESCVICQYIQQVYVSKLLKQLCHSCWAQDFNPVAIWIFNEGNSFHLTYKEKSAYENKTLYNHRII